MGDPMKPRTIGIVFVFLMIIGAGATTIWSFRRGLAGALEGETERPADVRTKEGGERGRRIPKRLAEAQKNPQAAIKELDEKYRGVAIGRLSPGSPEYRAFNGDCFLLGALDTEEADDLLADWFVKADEEEESPPNERKGRSLPSIRALIAINRPRWAVIERMLVSAQFTENPSKLYSWSAHLATRFYGNQDVLARLVERIASSEGLAAGRYRHLKHAVEDGPYGPLGPPDSSGVKK